MFAVWALPERDAVELRVTDADYTGPMGLISVCPTFADMFWDFVALHGGFTFWAFVWDHRFGTFEAE